MGLYRAISAQPRIFFSGVAVGAALLVTGYLLAMLGGSASATHGGSANIHGCLSVYTGQIRVMRPGQQPNCTASEILMEWPSAALNAHLEALAARVDALETENAGQLAALDTLTTDLGALTAQVPDCLSDDDGTALFDGCNVQIVSGLGYTEGVNGLGNLIVGYNEDLNIDPEERSGSHNLVVGADHTYTSYGGLVAGSSNDITGPYASVSGGAFNTASGIYASVSGGSGGTASGPIASVSGGVGNVASRNGASISGGFGNLANGLFASVSGGINNTASGDRASASGGFANTASGDSSSVSGGFANTASGDRASVGGGQGLTADDPSEHLP